MKFKLIENLEDLFEAKRPNLAVEEMKDILARNDDQVGKALVKLYELQTEDEKANGSTHKHNSVGFNILDAEILSNFAEFYMKHNKLTPKQLAIARKKIMKYAKQLVDIANSTTTASGTNSEKSNQVVLTLDMLEDLRLSESKSTSLSAGDINNIRNVIHHKLGIPTADMRIQPNGKFEFTNISEFDAIKISRGLERFDLASNIYQTKGAIDFNHFTPMGKPKNKFNITGELNLDKFLEENLAKINEASVSEDFVDYNANPQGRNEGDCTIRALSLAYNLSYANVKSELISLGNKNKSKFNTFPTINAFMEKHRFKKYLNNEDGSINVSTVENFAKKYHHGNYVVRCSDRSKQDMSHSFHLVAVIDGKIYDT